MGESSKENSVKSNAKRKQIETRFNDYDYDLVQPIPLGHSNSGNERDSHVGAQPINPSTSKAALCVQPSSTKEDERAPTCSRPVSGPCEIDEMQDNAPKREQIYVPDWKVYKDDSLHKLSRPTLESEMIRGLVLPKDREYLKSLPIEALVLDLDEQVSPAIHDCSDETNELFIPDWKISVNDSIYGPNASFVAEELSRGWRLPADAPSRGRHPSVIVKEAITNIMRLTSTSYECMRRLMEYHEESKRFNVIKSDLEKRIEDLEEQIKSKDDKLKATKKRKAKYRDQKYRAECKLQMTQDELNGLKADFDKTTRQNLNKIFQEKIPEAVQNAVNSYKSSKEFTEGRLEDAKDAYARGFGVCRQQLKNQFPELDIAFLNFKFVPHNYNHSEALEAYNTTPCPRDTDDIRGGRPDLHDSSAASILMQLGHQ